MTSAALAADSTRRNVRPRIMFWHAQQHAAKIRAAVIIIRDGAPVIEPEGQHGPASDGRLRRLRPAGDDALQPLLD